MRRCQQRAWRGAVCAGVAWFLATGPVPGQERRPAPPAASRPPGPAQPAGPPPIAVLKLSDQPDASQIPRGTSATKIRQEATDALPLDQLAPDGRRRVESLLKEVGYFRRVPTITFASDPRVYHYFLDHPDVAVAIWRALEISQIQLWHTAANQFEGDTKDGTVGVIDVLLRTPTHNIALCAGEFKSPLLKHPIKSMSLVHLETRSDRLADGTLTVTHRADLFVAFPSATVETAAKILSPVTGPLVDRNFYEMSMFVRMMSTAMTRKPGWVDDVSARLEGVAPSRRPQLLELTSELSGVPLPKRPAANDPAATPTAARPAAASPR